MSDKGRKTVRTSVILTDDVYARLQAMADVNNVSAAWVIRAAILNFLDERNGQTELPLQLPKTQRMAV